MNPGSPPTPSSPYTLSTDRYKANVNRTKTRKWVEAKKIDYGGDDWGADDDLEEDEAGDSGSANEPSQPIPQPLSSRPDRLAGLRAIGDGSGPSTPRSGSAGSARSLRPSERIALERQSSGALPRNFTAPPALHVNTSDQSQQPVQESSAAQQSPFPPRQSSMDQARPDLTSEPAVQHPPRTSSRSASAGSSTPSRTARPSEIVKHAEEEREGEKRSLDSSRGPTHEGLGSHDGSGAVDSQRRPSFGRNEANGSRGLPPLASLAEKQSEHGFDAPHPPVTSLSSNITTETARDLGTRQGQATSVSTETAMPTVTPDPRATVQQPSKRYSQSPKLPDLARMSGFGKDFFSGGVGLLGGSGSSGSPKQPAAPAQATSMPAPPDLTGVTRTAEPTTREEKTAALSNMQPPPEPSQPKPFRPALPGTWVSETPSSTGEMATPLHEQDANPRVAPIAEQPDDAALKPAPLRTPTPRDRESFSKFADDDRASERSSSLKQHPLRPTASRLSGVESSDQTPTQNHCTEELPKGSQIADATPAAPAPLQPRKSAVDLASQPIQPMARTDTMMTENSLARKESDVLRDEIIRSLSPAGVSDSRLSTQDDAGATRESAYLNDVYGDYWAGGDKKTEVEQTNAGYQPDASNPVKQGGSASATPPPPSAKEVESVKPAVRRERFSWEGSSAPSPAPSPTKHQHPLPELPRDSSSPPSGATRLDGPIHSDPLSPPDSLPGRRTDGENEDTRVKDESASGGLFMSTALGHGTDNDTSVKPSPPVDDQAGATFSPSTEKMTLDSPTTPTQPNFSSADPKPMSSDTPTGVPLPRSPYTPKAGGGARTTPPTSSGVHSAMNLKQIMALPTSPERVYTLHEARVEFATMSSGLEQWLVQLLAQPEHANAGPSFKYAVAGDDVPLFTISSKNSRRKSHLAAVAAAGGGDGAATGVGRRTSLTLGGGGGGGGSGGKVGSGIGIGAQAQLGHLMHGPAGAKGKELLYSAGKMGKGLLSKGKSKLRERAESKKA